MLSQEAQQAASGRMWRFGLPAYDQGVEEELIKAESERLGEFANEIAATMLLEHGMECSRFDVDRIERSLWMLAENLINESRWRRSAATNKALLYKLESARQLSDELGRLLSSESFPSPMSYLSWVYGRNIDDDVREEWGEFYAEDEEWATSVWLTDHSRGHSPNDKLTALTASIVELARASDLLIKALEQEMPHKPVNNTLLVVETMVPVYWDIFPRGRIGGTGNGKYARRGPLYTFVRTVGRLFGLDLKPDNIAKTIKRYRVPMHGTREE